MKSLSNKNLRTISEDLRLRLNILQYDASPDLSKALKEEEIARKDFDVQALKALGAARHGLAKPEHLAAANELENLKSVWKQTIFNLQFYVEQVEQSYEHPE